MELEEEKDDFKVFSEKAEKRLKYIIAGVLSMIAMGYMIIMIMEFLDNLETY